MFAQAPRPARLPLAMLLGGLLVLAPPGRSHAHEPVTNEVAEITARLQEHVSAADYLRRGELHRIEGHFEDALHDYAHAEQLDSTLREVNLCRGALYVDSGEPAAALKELDRYLDGAPDHDRALRLRARAWQQLDDPRAAVRDWDHALAVTKRPTPDDYYERAKILAALGDEGTREALIGLDQGLERLGPVVSLAMLAIDLEVRIESYDAALERLDLIAPQFARKELVDERRGHILLAAGRRAAARGAFVAALNEIESMPSHRRSTRSIAALETRLREALGELLDDGAEVDE